MSERAGHVSENDRRWWDVWYWQVLLGAGLAGLIVLVIGNWIVMPILTHTTSVQVPDLYDVELNEAREMVEDADLVFASDSADYLWDDVVPANHVVNQEPTPHTTITAGRSVRVIVSRGPRLYTVPSVHSLSITEARLRLEQAGFSVGRLRAELRPAPDPSDPFVVGQNPPPGTHLSARSPVNLVVSVSPEMPDILRRPLREALETLSYFGLVVGDTVFVQHPDFLPNSVVNQSIAPGSFIQAGDLVDVTVSSP